MDRPARPPDEQVTPRERQVQERMAAYGRERQMEEVRAGYELRDLLLGSDCPPIVKELLEAVDPVPMVEPLAVDLVRAALASHEPKPKP